MLMGNINQFLSFIESADNELLNVSNETQIWEYR